MRIIKDGTSPPAFNEFKNLAFETLTGVVR